MFAKCERKCGCLIIAVFTLSITVIYASHICGLCPAGFFHNGCLDKSLPICIRCPKGTYKTGHNAVAHCTKCSAPCLGRNSIVISVCNGTHDAECRCRDNHYLDKKTKSCIRCRKCPGRNNIMVKKCHGTHDTECRCKRDYYFDGGAMYCMHCSHCKRGQGVVKNCTRQANTQCERCVKGVSFSPKRSKTEPCILCKKCGENEEMVKQCTRRKDTICKLLPENKIKDFKLKNKSKWPESLSDKTTKVPRTSINVTVALDPTKADVQSTTTLTAEAKKRFSTKNTSELSTIELVLMVVGGVLGLVLLAFLVVGVWRWRRNKRTTADTPTIVKTAPPSYPHHPKTREEVNRLSRTPLMNGSTELLRNANFSIIEDLSTCLNPKARWKSLAAKLGFTSKDIENFELEPTQATERMLSEWSHQKDSTVQKLYDVLVVMKWSHEADVVYKHI